jgi:hypothetical protein
MQQGRMDSSGRKETETGEILGVLGTILGIVGFFIIVVALAASAQQSKPQGLLEWHPSPQLATPKQLRPARIPRPLD